MSKVYTLDGQIVNVGDWDYCVSVDEDGVEVVNNPLPEGAVEGDLEYTKDAKGSIRLCGDYYHLRKAEYPSVGDQLDALFKAGLFPEEMASVLQAIKDKYPKVTND
jgi:hypothetical protein